MTGVIATLCQIFADALDLDLVRPDDAFFDVGGDSVIALQVVARAREAGLVLSVRDLFDHQTPGELAVVAGGSGPSGSGVSPGGAVSARADAESALLTFSADELDEFADIAADQHVSGTEAGWETFT